MFASDELVDVVTLGDACQVVGITRADVNGETIDVSLEVSTWIFLSTFARISYMLRQEI